jgi:cytochrome P450
VAPIVYNPLDPEVHANPYPHYRDLREQDPVHHSNALGLWILTRYDDVAALLRDSRLGHEVTEGFAGEGVRRIGSRCCFAIPLPTPG